VIHGYNLNERVLSPNQLQHAEITFTNFIEFFVANGLLRFRITLLMTISGLLLRYAIEAIFYTTTETAVWVIKNKCFSQTLYFVCEIIT
jgi:hypothetical protein